MKRTKRPAGGRRAAGGPIGGAEAKAMAGILLPALAAPDQETRRALLAEALMTFGIRVIRAIGFIEREAPGDRKAAASALAELAGEMLLGWLSGERFTDRADEDGLRAIVALDAVEVAGGALARLAAKSVLRLPPGHPRRDLGRLREMLLERIDGSRRAGEWRDVLLIGGTLLANEILDPARAEALAEEMLAVADVPPPGEEPLDAADRTRAYVAVAGWHIARSIACREAGDADGAAAHRDRSAEVLRRGRAIERSFRTVLIEALVLEESGRSDEAIDLLAPLSDSDGETWEEACWLEGMIRLRLGHHARAADVLARVVPVEEERYVLATGQESIQSNGERLGKDAANLAFAYAYLGKWAKALEVLDRARSPRTRHAVALRRSPAGKELLALEARLASAARGVPGPAVRRSRAAARSTGLAPRCGDASARALPQEPSGPRHGTLGASDRSRGRVCACAGRSARLHGLQFHRPADCRDPPGRRRGADGEDPPRRPHWAPPGRADDDRGGARRLGARAGGAGTHRPGARARVVHCEVRRGLRKRPRRCPPRARRA